MIFNFFFTLSKAIKPFFKNKLINKFTLVEDMIINNFIFFITALIYYLMCNNDIKNIYDKLDYNTIKTITYFLLFTLFEIFLSYFILQKDLVRNKLINKSLSIILTPLVGIYLFEQKLNKNFILGSIFIIIGIFIIN